MQDFILRELQGKELHLGGDRRNDSPGHCATYCTYSFIEPISNLIVHQEVVDTRQADLKSPNMEKIGCEKGLTYLISTRKMKVKRFVTDDHNQISAMMSMYFKISFESFNWLVFLCISMILSAKKHISSVGIPKIFYDCSKVFLHKSGGNQVHVHKHLFQNKFVKVILS